MAKGDRLAGWALTEDGLPVVATARGLVLPGRELLAWHAIEKVSWVPPALSVRALADGPAVVAGTGPAYDVVLADPGGLPDVVRTCVTGSVAWSSHSALTGGGVRVVGRRNPDREVFDWQLVFDQGTDLDDPRVRAQAEQVLEAARRTIG